MKQERFEVKLYRRFEDGIKLLKTATVYEFNDECASYNVWSAAVQEFEKDLQENDYIQTEFETSKVCKSGDYGWGATIICKYK